MIPRLLGLGMAMLLVMASVSAAPAPKADPVTKLDPATQAKIHKLQIERRDVLKKAVAAMQEEYRAGRGTLDLLVEGSKRLLHAELDLATTADQRIAAHANILKITRDMEQLARTRYEAGQLRTADLCEAQAARLEAEIGWLKAGGKEKAEKKDK
jgi:hypothetical protein